MLLLQHRQETTTTEFSCWPYLTSAKCGSESGTCSLGAVLGSHA